MTISATDPHVPDAVDVRVSDEALTVELSDGRTIAVPLGWFPRLEYATAGTRQVAVDRQGAGDSLGRSR